MQYETKPHYEEFFEFAPDGLLVVEPGGRVEFVNRRAEALFGCARSKLIGRALGDLIPGITFAERLSGASGECAVRRRDGTEITVDVAFSRLGESGASALLALRDVTARKREEELLRSRARQQARVAELGRRALTGIDLAQLMAEAVNVLVSDLGVEYGSVLELLRDGRAVFRAGVGWRENLVGGTTVELRAGTPAGQVILDQVPILIDDLRADARFTGLSVARDHGVVSSLTVPIYGPTRPQGVLAVHAGRRREFSEGDVHFVQAVANVIATVMERSRQEGRQREQQMGRAEQLAALGQVAAGVAHEIRNPLTSIKGLVQVNLREADARGLPTEDLRVIEHEVRRMERTLQTFLDFARPPRPDRRRLELAPVVDQVFALVGGRARNHRVALRLLRPDEPVQVDGDRDQLQQLVLNLVLNALDAVPDGGALEIDLRPARDGYVELHARDTGPGIPAHILPKVFEAFVSTKGTGLGLGLAVSRRIAEDHDGTLVAYNLPDGGSCFALRLPAPT